MQWKTIFSYSDAKKKTVSYSDAKKKIVWYSDAKKTIVSYIDAKKKLYHTAMQRKNYLSENQLKEHCLNEHDNHKKRIIYPGLSIEHQSGPVMNSLQCNQSVCKEDGCFHDKRL